MRLVRLFVSAAIAAAAPSLATAAVMVARFEGTVGGIHNTVSDRFGQPPFTSFSGPFAAEVVYDSSLGVPVSAGVGGEGRSFGAIKSIFIEWSGIRLELPQLTSGRVLARAAGFSVQVQNYQPNLVMDTLTLNANFAGASGDLETPVGTVTATTNGWLQAYSWKNGAFQVDLDGDCNFASCAGMRLETTRFTLSEYAAPTKPPAVPEPSAWALMMLGFGGLGTALRRRRAAYA